MKKHIITLVLLLTVSLTVLKAQTDTVKPKLSFSGFVNTQMFYDSRQTIGGRETLLMIYPANISKDNAGNDLNATPSFNQLSMMTRLTANISGIEFLGARATSLFEGDFTGHSNSDNNGFRLRHAWVKLNWKSSELLIGQYWSPINAPEAIPGVLGLSTGAPFRPFSRHIQIRYSKSISNLKLIAVAASQRDYASEGPDGNGAQYMRNAVLPNLHGQVQYKFGNFLFGTGLDYKMLEPRMKGKDGNATEKKLGSMAAMGFVAYKNKTWDVKAQYVWGENMSEHVSIGGYYELTDTVAKKYSYENTAVSSMWIDASYSMKAWKFGIFSGYLKNLNYDDITPGTFYGRGDNIDYLYRIAPRIIYAPGKLAFATEFDYTTAAYDQTGNKVKRGESTEVSNLRIILGVTYTF